jgi:predicted nucleic acid-binding protein
VFEDEGRVRTAVRGFIEGLDMADALIIGIAQAAGCDRLASFDDALKAKAPGFIVRPESE